MNKRCMLYCFVLLAICLAGCGKGDLSCVQAATQVQESQVQASREAVPVGEVKKSKTDDSSEGVPVGEMLRSDLKEAHRASPVLESIGENETEETEDTPAETGQEPELTAEGEEREHTGEEQALAEEEEERELTEQELKKLQWSIRSSDNGFFACLYDRPEEIDWEQVLYSGAGMNVALNEGQLDIIREALREEIRLKREKEEELWYQYLSANSRFLEEQDGEAEEEQEQEEEIEVNLTAANVTTLTLRSIQNFVKNRTGMEYSEARHPINWPSLTRNVFYFVHEGNNRVTIRLISAKVKGNVYTLYYRKDNKRGATDPEYVMVVEKEGNQWKFISNLSLNQTPPITMLDIDYYNSGELVRLQGTKEMITVSQEESDGQTSSAIEAKESKKGTGKTGENLPKFYWAVITAREDNTVLHVENAYLGDDISTELAGEGYFIPADEIASVTLQRGEKVGVRVALEDIPKCRVWATCGDYYGEYAFGCENSLKRIEEDGTPKSTYVLGHNVDGEGRGTSYRSKEELLNFLKGTWVYYDSTMGDYTAKLCIGGEKEIEIAMPGLTYRLVISKWNRVYVDEKGAPDVVTFQTADEATQELIDQWYPAIKKRLGDYRLRAIQRDGMQILYLTPENAGVGCLNYLLPGADESMDEFVFYRFLGTQAQQQGELENTKG